MPIPKSKLDDRAVFVNRICKMIWQLNDSDVYKAVKYLNKSELNAHIHEHIRNVYELIDEEIPLLAVRDLLAYGAGNWDYTKEEYQNHLEYQIKQCSKYYS